MWLCSIQVKCKCLLILIFNQWTKLSGLLVYSGTRTIDRRIYRSISTKVKILQAFKQMSTHAALLQYLLYAKNVKIFPYRHSKQVFYESLHKSCLVLKHTYVKRVSVTVLVHDIHGFVHMFTSVAKYFLNHTAVAYYTFSNFLSLKCCVKLTAWCLKSNFLVCNACVKFTVAYTNSHRSIEYFQEN